MSAGHWMHSHSYHTECKYGSECLQWIDVSKRIPTEWKSQSNHSNLQHNSQSLPHSTCFLLSLKDPASDFWCFFIYCTFYALYCCHFKQSMPVWITTEILPADQAPGELWQEQKGRFTHFRRPSLRQFHASDLDIPGASLCEMHWDTIVHCCSFKKQIKFCTDFTPALRRE